MTGDVIFLVMGLPGGFVQWCSAAVMRLAARSGEVAGIAWPPLDAMLAGQALSPILEELGALLVANDAAHVVVSAHRPDDRLRELLLAREIPFLLALDDPGIIAADIIGATGADAAPIVRALANLYPFLMRYDGLAGALLLTSERAAADPAAAIRAIAAHFGIAIAAADAAAIASELAPLGMSRAADQAPDRAGDLSADAGKLLDGALSAYHRHFLSGTLGEIVWSRDLFLRSDGGSPREPIDATGGERYLVYGPYIRLPAGQWTARVVLGFSPETVGSSFVVDAVADGGQLAYVAIDPERGGVYAADLDFAIEEGSGSGLEIRVMAAGERVRGRVALGQVILQRRSAGRRDPIDSAEDFEAALAL